MDVDTQKDEYKIWIGDKFDYTLFKDEQALNENKSKKVIKGEGIIRALESEQGIERLFIPIEYVRYDTMSRSCKVAISENWNYYGKPVPSVGMTEQEQKKSPSVRFKRRQIQQALKSQEPRLDIQIQAKMAMLQGRMKKQRTEELISTLNTIREEGLSNHKELTERLNEVKQEKNLAQEKIAVAEKKLENFTKLSKLTRCAS